MRSLEIRESLLASLGFVLVLRTAAKSPVNTHLTELNLALSYEHVVTNKPPGQREGAEVGRNQSFFSVWSFQLPIKECKLIQFQEGAWPVDLGGVAHFFCSHTLTGKDNLDTLTFHYTP